MTNKEIARQFQLLAQIMELHGENKFKIRSYSNAYLTIKKLPTALSEMSEEDINALKGIGKATAAKIKELLESGQIKNLEKYKSQTPEGIQEMLSIKGFGPKKIEVIWKELGVESIGELLYAVNENRLIELKGFGAKTQEDLKQKLEYYQKSKYKFHYAALLEEADNLQMSIQERLPQAKIVFSGALARAENVVEQIEFIISSPLQDDSFIPELFSELKTREEGHYVGLSQNQMPLSIRFVDQNDFGRQSFVLSSSEEFLSAFQALRPELLEQNYETEQALFDTAGLPFIIPSLRSKSWSLELAQADKIPQLITGKDIKGVVHSHSTYSDGLNSLSEMAEYTKAQGYEYLLMTDHSKSAFYANGLKPERVYEQFEEIEALNKKLAPFKIFKGIESDILADGSLDYEDDLLAQFDAIIASVHSNLRMDEQKATNRIINAVENPYTHILGHPTGRLLLSRKGYPINHIKVIDACAANKVSIELNANPYRLDLDWTWIPYALEKGVLISINPDAHSTSGIHHIKYGIISARKGGLDAENCLNARGAEAFIASIKK